MSEATEKVEGLPEEEVSRRVEEYLSGEDLDGRRVVVVIPDGTRTAPIPQMFRLICGSLAGRVASLEFLIALGTHRGMDDAQIDHLLGLAPGERGDLFKEIGVHNHEWWEDESFVSLGTISSGEVEEISSGALRESVDVRVNRRVAEAEVVIVCGPVFPHEVVGFSGGNKYFFPGVGGPEVIDLSHWLGALITNREMIGRRGTTPVRRLIDRAAVMIPTRRLCISMVISPEEGMVGLFCGSPEDSWRAAADLSSRVNVRYVQRPFRRVLSVMPESYEDIWTAAKGMYKLEPAVADGGEVVIFAPHITQFSYSHGEDLAQVGYHVRDYFTKQWERFGGYPGTILAHSTHLKGAGTYNPKTGEERPRVRVTLATGISRERCEAHSVGYLDPEEVDFEEWRGREDEGIVLIPKAGEVLFRLDPGS